MRTQIDSTTQLPVSLDSTRFDIIYINIRTQDLIIRYSDQWYVQFSKDTPSVLRNLFAFENINLETPYKSMYDNHEQEWIPFEGQLILSNI